eukprot:148738-Hanusia_phi.AAC.1
MAVSCDPVLLEVHLGPVLHCHPHLPVVADLAFRQDALSPSPVRQHPNGAVVADLALADHSLPSVLAHHPVHPVPVDFAPLTPRVPVVRGQDGALAAAAKVARLRHEHAVLRHHDRDPPVAPDAAVAQAQRASEALDRSHRLPAPPRRVSPRLVHRHAGHADIVGEALEEGAPMAALQHDAVVALTEDRDGPIDHDLLLVQASVHHDLRARCCSADGSGDACIAAHACSLDKGEGETAWRGSTLLTRR